MPSSPAGAALPAPPLGAAVPPFGAAVPPFGAEPPFFGWPTAVLAIASPSETTNKAAVLPLNVRIRISFITQLIFPSQANHLGLVGTRHICAKPIALRRLRWYRRGRTVSRRTLCDRTGADPLFFRRARRI